MNHPRPEEWVPYLSGEARPDIGRQLDTHLRECRACRDEVERWERALGRLDAWKLPRVSQPLEAFVPVFKWAVAAMAALCVAFGVGRFTAPRPNLEQLRAALEPELRRQVAEEVARVTRQETSQAATATLAAAGKQTEAMLTAYDDALARRWSQDSQTVYAVLNGLETRRLDDYLALKRELDTVAVNTDAGLRETEQQLVQLADYHPAAASDSPSPQP